jgi:hypothetical protein
VQWYDGLVTLPGCDKNMPGAIMATARLNRPSLMVYGGTIRPGVSQLTGEPLDIVSAFQSFGAYANKMITEEQRQDQVRPSSCMRAARAHALLASAAAAAPGGPPLRCPCPSLQLLAPPSAPRGSAGGMHVWHELAGAGACGGMYAGDTVCACRCGMHARARARAAACTRPTQWPRPSRRWE